MTKSLYISFAIGLASGGMAMAQTEAEYRNTGVVTAPLNIDALNFINLGDFRVLNEGEVYRTFNTINFTNRGVINAPISGVNQGFQFATVSGGSVTNAMSFVNQGEIYLGEGFDDFSVLLAGAELVGLSYYREGWTKIDVWAENVLNNGLMDVGIAGEVLIRGDEVNLRRSGLRSGPNRNSGFVDGDFLIFNDDGHLIYYANPKRIFDLYWATGTNSVVFDIEDRGFPIDLSEGQFDLPNPVSPSHEVFTGDPAGAPGTIGGFVQIPFAPLENYDAFVFTNLISTNSIASVVFVPTSLDDGTITSEVTFQSFGPGGIVPTVELRYLDPDPVLGEDVVNSIFITDELMLTAQTDDGTFTGENLFSLGYRAENYFLSRGNFGIGLGGQDPNSTFNFDSHIWDASAPGQPSVVTNNYAAYSISVDIEPDILLLTSGGGLIGVTGSGDIDSRAEGVFGIGIENAALFDPAFRSGRVTINAAGNLDMEKTRVRGEYYSSVTAGKSIKTDEVTLIDAPVVSLDLTSTNGLLQVQNLLPRTVRRLSGSINVYSTFWTNSLPVLGQDEEGNTVTNGINQIRHVMIVDPGDLRAIQNVSVDSLTLSATNVVLANPMFATGPVLLDAESVNITTDFFVGETTAEIGNARIDDSNMPRLREFELSSGGEMRVLNEFEIGQGNQDGQVESVIIGGVVVASALDFAADEIQVSGVMTTDRFSAGPIRLRAENTDLSLSALLSNGDFIIESSNLTLQSAQIGAGGFFDVAGGLELGIGRLYLAISDSMDDGGPAGGSLLQVTDGFEMSSKPPVGDLLGTFVESTARRFREISHVWAGEDRGASEAGFENNMAIGALQLTGGEFSLFTFVAPQGDNALYVRDLFLNGYTAENFEDGFFVEPGMKVYFSTINGPVGELDPAEFDGMFDGRLIHVAEPAGSGESYTNSSGQLVRVSEAVLYSPTLDSDGDGIMNAYDSDPLGGVLVEVERVAGENPTTLIKWNGAARTNYRVEFKDSIEAEGWNLLTSITTNMRAKQVVVEDDSENGGLRIYRVIYLP